ncbi:TPA: fimbrial protein [Escherichia coli]|nr:fimbrial protein [Escherichia coli]
MRKLFLSLLMIPFVAKANFMIYPISKEIKGGSSELIRIYSKSKDTQYIKVYTKKVLNPGTKEEYEVDTPNWEGGLVTTPSKVILPGGGSKSVRLSQLKDISSEDVYRVYFESIKPEKQDGLSKNKSLKTDLSVNIIYAALIRVLPKDGKSDMRASLSPKSSLLIKNTGNVRVGIKDAFFCKKTSINNDDCIKKTYNKNIYPGSSFDTEVIQNGFSHIFIDSVDGSAGKQGKRMLISIH